MQDRDTILTINVVEPSLVHAVNLQSKALGRPLKGLVLVHSEYAAYQNRPKDSTGLFEEVVCDFDNVDELQSALKPYTDRLLAATCRYEEALQPFSKVIPFLPYIHTPSEKVLEWSTEKPLMRDRLCNYDRELVPKYQYLEGADMPRLHDLVEDFNFPVIVKPSGLAKALLVTHCENEAELKDRLEHTFRIIQGAYAKEHYPGKPSVLVEEMMQGDMYSTDVYVTHDGEIFCLPLVKVVTAHSLGMPGFYGHHGTLPSVLDEKEVEAAFAASRASIKALNLSATTAHIELFHTKQGWKIIEVAARIGGHRVDMYREAYGIEHFYNDLAIRMGDKPTMPADPISNTAFLNIYAEQEGYIESFEGLEEARNLPSIVYLATHAGVGDLALFAENGGDQVVDGILSNTDADQLQADIAKVEAMIKIKIRSINS